MAEDKVFILDGFEGAAKGGAMYRSRIHLDIDEFETNFKEKVIGIKLCPKESGSPSWTIEFILDATDELEKIKEINNV